VFGIEKADDLTRADLERDCIDGARVACLGWKRLLAAARSPASRSGTLKTFVSSLTWTTASDNESEPPWRNYETAGRFNDASHGQ
jgi:hypothetical protein